MKFKYYWTLLTHIFSSSKGIWFAHCELCTKHLITSHGGMNDIKHHLGGTVHQQKYIDLQGSASISN